MHKLISSDFIYLGSKLQIFPPFFQLKIVICDISQLLVFQIENLNMKTCSAENLNIEELLYK